MNKYERTPDRILDLHGHTVVEAKRILDALFESSDHRHIRIITGTGAFRATGPVLKTFVREYLAARGAHFNPAKRADGGDGAYEVFLR